MNDLTYTSSGGSPVTVAHACVAMEDGRMYCWGDNDRGQLGQGTGGPASSATPLAVPGFNRARAVTVGAAHSCAVDTAGEVWCWGANNGRLGTADATDAHSPTRLFGFPVRVAPSVTP
ncbi:MAG: hypothetical protein IT378_11230 [Sandaracinaceae bacterium]|nr:hypothetical protein [Sandaracinaceae bacterium]